MSYPLRLPVDLDADARARADRLGISLNALICVALDGFLRGPELQPAPLVPGAPVVAAPASAAVAPAPVARPILRKQKRKGRR